MIVLAVRLMTKDPQSTPRIHHRNLKESDTDPEVALIHTLAEIKGVDETELTQLYFCINNMVENLFRSPPPAEATAQLMFSYEGYHITIYQDGHAVFQRLGEE